MKSYGDAPVPASELLPYLVSQFWLQTKVNRFGAALRTYARIMKLVESEQAKGIEPTPGMVEQLTKARDSIERLRDTDQAIPVAGGIDETTNSWFFRPLRTKFTITDLEHDTPHRAELAEIKLRCDRGYKFFRHKPDIRYDFSGSGSCYLQIVGNPGTRFTLVEL